MDFQDFSPATILFFFSPSFFCYCLEQYSVQLTEAQWAHH